MAKRSDRQSRAKGRQAYGRDSGASKPHNKLSQAQNRWQRAVRYTWDKNRGRG